MVSGFLLALGIYHFLLYFQNKDKAYLYYSIYTFLVFIYSYHRAEHFILSDISRPLIPYLHFLYDPIKWLYSTTYLLFAIHFIDLNKYFPKWHNALLIFTKVSYAVLFIITLSSFFFNKQTHHRLHL